MVPSLIGHAHAPRGRPCGVGALEVLGGFEVAEKGKEVLEFV